MSAVLVLIGEPKLSFFKQITAKKGAMKCINLGYIFPKYPICHLFMPVFMQYSLEIVVFFAQTQRNVFTFCITVQIRSESTNWNVFLLHSTMLQSGFITCHSSKIVYTLEYLIQFYSRKNNHIRLPRIGWLEFILSARKYLLMHNLIQIH